MASKSFKATDIENIHFKLFRFFQSISDKNYGKNCYLDNFLFLPPFPINNIENKWAKILSSDVMSSHHCIGGEGGLLNTFFKFPIIFFHNILCVWCSFLRKERLDAMHAVLNNSYLPYWARLCRDTLPCQYNNKEGTKMTRCF